MATKTDNKTRDFSSVSTSAYISFKLYTISNLQRTTLGPLPYAITNSKNVMSGDSGFEEKSNEFLILKQ